LAKKKLIRFEELNGFSHVIQPCEKYSLNDHALKGNWSEKHFLNQHNIVLEVGCGKGEYTIALAKSNISTNYIGIDIKGDRIWRGATEALAGNLSNVAFLRVQAQQLPSFFAPNEVSEIWLTFPDPQLQKPKERKRLTSPNILETYRKVLCKEGLIHLKTDNLQLFDYTLDVVNSHGHVLHYCTYDLHGQADPATAFLRQHLTYYENMYLKKGVSIKYLRFSLR